MIGAHWDSFASTPGFNDNGSGVMALMETARILAKKNLDCFNPDFSIIFAVFDAEERGCRGSQHFVTSFMVPLFRQGIKMQGAIILDTILNFDPAPGSQFTTPVSYCK